MVVQKYAVVILSTKKLDEMQQNSLNGRIQH